PEDRTIKELLNNGVISLNKPDGPTSHQVADYAKRILGADKVGHGGTLEI
ncbi:MAG: RNA-guided pseudouridylation complex pseudouridine synthase subunit Cbf5, partial [Nanoarchaeota archaeon]